MRKKALILALAAVLGASTIPVANISARSITALTSLRGTEEDDEDDEDTYEEEEEDAQEITAGDIVVKPSKKTIKMGQSFYISFEASPEFEKDHEFTPDEVWDEILEEGISGVKYKSTRASVAYVSKKGKVKGKKKGSAVIKTTVTFTDGSEQILKTTVYVTR